MDLINNLLKCKNSSNKEVIKELIEFIKDNNITSKKDLKRYEDMAFTFNGVSLDYKEKVKYYSDYISKCLYDYDELDNESIIIYKNLKASLNTNIKVLDKIRNIIKINILTNRDIMFYSVAYDLVIKNMY